MATKVFGTHDQPEQTTKRDYATELYKLIGAKFPLVLTVDPNGTLIGASYETEWSEGGTEPIEGKAGEITYKENYTKQKLTKDQIKTLDNYLDENVTLQS